MNMTIKDEAHKKRKVKKQKDNILEINTQTIIKKTEKMTIEKSDFKDLKKKKRKLTSDPEIVTGDANEFCKKKRIVENVHTDSAENREAADVLLLCEDVKDKKKRKKTKKKSMQTKSNVEIILIEDEDDNAVLDMENTRKNANEVKTEIVTNTMKTKKKKKTKLLTAEDIETAKESKSKKSKSKLEKSCIKIEFSDRNHFEKAKKKRVKNNAEEIKECKNKMNKDFKVSLRVGNEQSEDSSKVKKKKHPKKSENEMYTAVDKEVTETEQDGFQCNQKPKKKKKKSKRDIESLLVDVEALSQSKQKKSSKKVESKVDIGAGKKKKIKKEQVDHEESSQMEVVFLSEKAGNIDEVNVNKERRKALQMEVDQASQPKKPAKTLGLGQWSTAEFGSSDQQQKFLRLMGGFKKGSQLDSANGGGGNMALGRNAQQQLQQGLLGEFQRAHSRRMDSSKKGTGLGFIAPSTKTFSIDANVTRSIRFDD